MLSRARKLIMTISNLIGIPSNIINVTQIESIRQPRLITSIEAFLWKNKYKIMVFNNKSIMQLGKEHVGPSQKEVGIRRAQDLNAAKMEKLGQKMKTFRSRLLRVDI